MDDAVNDPATICVLVPSKHIPCKKEFDPTVNPWKFMFPDTPELDEEP